MATENYLNQILREDAFNKQDIIDFIRGGGAAGGGTNLAGQPQPGSYGFYTPDFSYGSYKMPYEDPTYRSGFEYARTIAGGMPFEDVVAPGMSFSPDQPMGYTQEDLTPRFYNEGPVPVMPSAPTKGTPLEASYETMPYAPVGTPAPERYIPGQTSFPGIPDFLKDLDFSFLKDLDFSGLPKVTEEVAGEPGPVTDFFKVDQNLFNFEEIADKIDMDEVAKIDIEKINIPESVSLFSDILKEPVSAEPVSAEPVIPKPVLPSIFEPAAPVMPTMPMEPMVQPIKAPVIPAQPLPQNIFANIPKPQPMPMPMPVIPNIPKPPIVPQPIVPQPIPPMNLTRLSNLPVSNFVQPSVEEIVSPIRIGRTLPPTPRGLFSL